MYIFVYIINITIQGLHTYNYVCHMHIEKQNLKRGRLAYACMSLSQFQIVILKPKECLNGATLNEPCLSANCML